MPSSSIDFRPRIGLFYTTLKEIIARKQKRYFEKNYGKSPKSRFKSEVKVWASCMSAMLAYVLCTTILLQANDVETNPGPTGGITEDILFEIAQNQQSGFSHVLQQFQSLQNKLDRIFTYWQNIHENLNRKLEEQESCIERLEQRNHQNNIRVIGFKEHDYDLDKIVSLLNKYSRDPQWRATDIAYAYRLGDRKPKHDAHPRPLIVSLKLAEDKTFILTDKKLRQSLWENENIKLAADLSQRQQDELNFYRDQGYKAYFKNGQVCVEDKKGFDPRNYHFRSRESSQMNMNEYDKKEFHNEKNSFLENKHVNQFNTLENENLVNSKQTHSQQNGNLMYFKPPQSQQNGNHAF